MRLVIAAWSMSRLVKPRWTTGGSASSSLEVPQEAEVRSSSADILRRKRRQIQSFVGLADVDGRGQ